MLLSRFIISGILILNILEDGPADSVVFIPPVLIPLAFSANFGEPRTDHFHSGIDIKTEGVTGKEVIAAASGYIYRISVASAGYGKALYIKHPNGYSTVYGHLESFIPEVNEYVKDRQYEMKSFQVNIYPPRERFRVKQGDLIGYSGNSGSSGGPHLHYEIRESGTESPVNPFLFDFGNIDNIKPVIKKLAVYPVTRNTLINGMNRKLILEAGGSNGIYNLPGNQVISISGSAGFGLESFDLLNESNNKCGIYSIELRIDNIIRFCYVMDKISFRETRYINSHIDYETYQRDNTCFERTYILPNDKLGVYRNVINRGIFNFIDDSVHQVRITMSDVHDNHASLDFKVRSHVAVTSRVNDEKINETTMIPHERSSLFRAPGIVVSIPRGCLYDTLFFKYRRNAGTPQMLSSVHHVHDRYTPVHKAFTISIRPDTIPPSKESKLLIVQLVDDYIKTALTSSFRNGYVTSEAMSFGTFYVDIDTTPPVVTANGLKANNDLTGRSEIRIKVHDDLSGIGNYEPMIDGKWALFEHDQKNNELIYRFDEQRIGKGAMHELALKVSDNKGNQVLFSYSFLW